MYKKRLAFSINEPGSVRAPRAPCVKLWSSHLYERNFLQIWACTQSTDILGTCEKVVEEVWETTLADHCWQAGGQLSMQPWRIRIRSDALWSKQSQIETSPALHLQGLHRVRTWEWSWRGAPNYIRFPKYKRYGVAKAIYTCDQMFALCLGSRYLASVNLPALLQTPPTGATDWESPIVCNLG
jgi:hypothetical protein